MVLQIISSKLYFKVERRMNVVDTMIRDKIEDRNFVINDDRYEVIRVISRVIILHLETKRVSIMDVKKYV